MKQFKTILRFELTNYFKNKIFVGVTLFLVAVISVVMFFPRLSAALTSDDASEQERSIMLVETKVSENAALIEETFAAAFPAYEVRMTGSSIDQMQAQITAGEASCAFLIESFTSYTYYVNNLSIYDTNTDIADEALRNIYRMSAMTAQGLSADEASAILSVPVEHNNETFGNDQFQNYFYT